MVSMNHGKPAYKKEATGQGVAVMIYFWDERDGIASAGWWIGPEIGGNMVWGHHSSRSSSTPPTSGWNAPHSSPVDPTMTLSVATVAPPPAPVAAAVVAPPPAAVQPPPYMQRGAGYGAAQQQQQAQQAQLWQAKAAEQQKQKALMEAQRKQREEEAKKKAMELQKRKEEQAAAIGLRKTLLKLKAVTPESFDGVRAEVNKVLATELSKCGLQKDLVKAEADKEMKAAEARIETVKEARRKNEERLKELEAKKEEARAAAKKLLSELAELVDSAEDAAKSLTESVEGFVEKIPSLGTKALVEQAVSGPESEAEAATERAKAVFDFLKTHSPTIRNAPPPALTPANKEKKEEQGEEVAKEPTLPDLTKRGGLAKGTIEKEVAALKTSKAKAFSEAAAKQVLKEQEALFKKYDKNKDQFLDKSEIKTFASKEYSYAVPEDLLTTIWMAIVPEKAKGVSFDEFQRLIAVLGIGREELLDQETREARIQREEELAEKKKEFQAVIDGADAKVKALLASVAELSEAIREFQKDLKTTKAAAMLESCAKFEETLNTLATAMKEAEEEENKFVVQEGDEENVQLKTFIKSEKIKVTVQVKNVATQMERIKASLTNFKLQAARKEELEVKELGVKALALLKAHQKQKSLSPLAMFKEMCGGTESLSDDAFASFMESLPEVEGAEQKLSHDDFKRAFTALDEEKEGKISSEAFVPLLWKVMKVVKQIALTPDKSMSDTTVLRRLEEEEVLEVLEGPVVEEEVQRIRVRALQDDLEGWVSVVGTQGTLYLKEGGNKARVVKETILTECFEIDGKNPTTKKDTTRKVKNGEELDIRVWGKKDATGLTRMKVRAKTDGRVGWVTAVGNTGIKYVIVL